MKHRYLKLALFSMIATPSFAAEPIDGWYLTGFGGYAYFPNNVTKLYDGIVYDEANYESEYNAGGGFGYQSNPMRYEGQVTYLNGMLDNVFENGLKIDEAAGYTNAVLGLVNVYYDFPMVIPTLSPFLGAGVGYGWINVKVDNERIPDVANFRVADSAFAYQGTAGITFNFAENYALNVAFRYVGTNNIGDLGKPFQAYMANAGIVYRYEGAQYK